MPATADADPIPRRILLPFGAAWVLLAVFLIGASTYSARVRGLEGTGPRVDHSFFSVWLQDLHRASHWLPRVEGGDDFRSSQWP
jgi:hypothetical protein